MNEWLQLNAWQILKIGLGLHALLISLEYLTITRTRLGPSATWGRNLVTIRAYRSGNILASKLSASFIVVTMNITRLCGGVGLVVLPTSATSPIFLLMILSAHFIDIYRIPLFREGSDDLSVIAATAAFGVTVLPQYSGIFVFLIVSQVCLSYWIAGSMKFRSPRWRSGQALKGIVTSYTYGMPCRLTYGTPQLWYRVLSWFVIVWELLFSFFLLWSPGLMVACLMGATFHISCAFVMHLNRFPVVFISSYPLVLLAGSRLTIF